MMSREEHRLVRDVANVARPLRRYEPFARRAGLACCEEAQVDGNVGVIVDREGGDESLDPVFVQVMCELADVGVVGDELRNQG